MKAKNRTTRSGSEDSLSSGSTINKNCQTNNKKNAKLETLSLLNEKGEEYQNKSNTPGTSPKGMHHSSPTKSGRTSSILSSFEDIPTALGFNRRNSNEALSTFNVPPVSPLLIPKKRVDQDSPPSIPRVSSFGLFTKFHLSGENKTKVVNEEEVLKEKLKIGKEVEEKIRKDQNANRYFSEDFD